MITNVVHTASSQFIDRFHGTDPIIDQIMPGSQTDSHGCVLDGGYQWCESNQLCHRAWEEDCPELKSDLINTEFCESSHAQMCRMVCESPTCPEGQCAMRNENCCDYSCASTTVSHIECPSQCPPPSPCPMPPMRQGCRYIPAEDKCGCSIGCGSVDCSTGTTQDIKSQEGESCGGFMPYGMAHMCEEGLECVNTMGPFIADAPGSCRSLCPGNSGSPVNRDRWGNCIDEGCSEWYDGCNTCDVGEHGVENCSEQMCYSNDENPHCNDNDNDNDIPDNCLTWYDGCNTCSVNHGVLQGCTMMMCFVENNPYCESFSAGKLRIGEICYRFCEDNSQSLINRAEDCPQNSECSYEDLNEVVFDSCGPRAHTCNLITGH